LKGGKFRNPKAEIVLSPSKQRKGREQMKRGEKDHRKGKGDSSDYRKDWSEGIISRWKATVEGRY